MNRQRSFSVFVSSVSFEDRLIALWGQRNPHAVEQLESSLPSHCASGWVIQPRSPNEFKPGVNCFHFNGNKFLRLRVRDVRHRDVLLFAIDYGYEISNDFENLLIADLNDPYFLQPDYAEKFIVAGLALKRTPTTKEKVTLNNILSQIMWNVTIEEKKCNQVFASFTTGNNNMKETLINTGLVEIYDQKPAWRVRQIPGVPYQAPAYQVPTPRPAPAIGLDQLEPKEERYKNPVVIL